MGIIEDLNLGDDILQLDREGYSLREIRKELIKRHPELPRIPSVNSTSRFLNKKKLFSAEKLPNRFTTVHYE
jgi:hypothetical protein